jgi:hypothetical protein
LHELALAMADAVLLQTTSSISGGSEYDRAVLRPLAGAVAPAGGFAFAGCGCWG